MVALPVAVVDRARRRETERPRIESLLGEAGHLCDLFVGRRLVVVATSITHHVGAQRRMRHLGPDVDGVRDRFDCVQIFGERLPLERDPLAQRSTRDVLDALHDADQEIVPVGLHGGKPHPTVAHHHRCHPVPRRRRDLRVPDNLAVVVGVDVDEPGRDQLARRVDLLATGVGNLTHCRDAAIVDRHVGSAGRCARAIDHGAVTNHQIVHVSSSYFLGVIDPRTGVRICSGMRPRPGGDHRCRGCGSCGLLRDRAPRSAWSHATH